MDIEIIPCLNDNYSYLIKDDQTDTVAIIDLLNLVHVMKK